MAPYLKLAKKYGAEVEIVHCNYPGVSIHNVPHHVMQHMAMRWEA